MMFGLCARMSSTSVFSFSRTLGILLVRKTSEIGGEPVEDVAALVLGEVEGEAELAAVGVLQDRRHRAGEHRQAR